MLKISVIIPVYNGEKYIDKCLKSVLNQTYKNIEIIIINDDSTDKTPKILEKYKNEYQDIIQVVTCKENGGQGKARNIGINLAKGDFITFVDSDDTIDKTMLEKLINVQEKENADIVICDYYEIIDEKKYTKKAIYKKHKNIQKDYITCVAGPCNKIIKTKLLKENNLYFAEIGAYEDISIIPLIGIYANKIAYVEENLYNYYIRKGSTMRQNKFHNKLLSIYDSLNYLENGFYNSNKINEYKEELEFIYIKHLLYAGSGRFLQYKETRNQINKIVKIMSKKYPNWKKNKYYKEQNKMFKLNCNIFYTNCLFIILPFRKFIKLVNH